MANQRSPGQTLVAFALDKELKTALDTARARTTRSAYIRDAVVERLRADGVTLPKSLADSPERTGKVYRPRKITSYKAEAKKRKPQPG